MASQNEKTEHSHKSQKHLRSQKRLHHRVHFSNCGKSGEMGGRGVKAYFKKRKIRGRRGPKWVGAVGVWIFSGTTHYMRLVRTQRQQLLKLYNLLIRLFNMI